MILESGKVFTSRCFGIKQYEIHKKEILKYFEDLLINHLVKTSKTHIVFPLKKLAKENVFTFQEFKNKYSDGEILKIFYGRFGYPTELISYAKGNAFRNKKRPEHGVKVSKKLTGIDRGNKWRELKKLQNKSIDFKITFLKNKNIEVKSLSEAEIIQIYNNYISSVRSSIEYKKQKLKKFLSSDKYNQYTQKQKIMSDNFDELSEEEILNRHKIMMSIISHESMKHNKNMGSTKFFKRGILKVKYCKNRSKIHFKSSLERDFIIMLESINQTYEYESLLIDKINGGIYIPDFVLEIDNEKYIIELKGFVRGDEGKKSEKEKIKSAVKFILNKAYKYIYFRTGKLNITLDKILTNHSVENADDFIKTRLKWV